MSLETLAAIRTSLQPTRNKNALVRAWITTKTEPPLRPLIELRALRPVQPAETHIARDIFGGLETALSRAYRDRVALRLENDRWLQLQNAHVIIGLGVLGTAHLVAVNRNVAPRDPMDMQALVTQYAAEHLVSTALLEYDGCDHAPTDTPLYYGPAEIAQARLHGTLLTASSFRTQLSEHKLRKSELIPRLTHLNAQHMPRTSP